jgi:hypothetical protein
VVGINERNSRTVEAGKPFILLGSGNDVPIEISMALKIALIIVEDSLNRYCTIRKEVLKHPL